MDCLVFLEVILMTYNHLRIKYRPLGQKRLKLIMLNHNIFKVTLATDLFIISPFFKLINSVSKELRQN